MSTEVPQQEATKCSEDERDYFRIRAKVYRFADNEWKERGQGEVLIAENAKEKKYRLLLHRDQTLKCAVNLPLVEGVAIKQLGNSAKAITIAGLDFSDNEKKQTVFAVKFTEEWMCKNFRTALEHALAGKELKESDLVQKPSEDTTKDAKKDEKAEKEVDKGDKEEDKEAGKKEDKTEKEADKAVEEVDGKK